MMISQVRNPQCFVDGVEDSGSSLSFDGGSFADDGQAYFVRQSSRRVPFLRDRNRGSPISKSVKKV
jgi:hypothetical protein